jgi:lipopolysaccharide export LptBFGC system permease protein LptF
MNHQTYTRVSGLIFLLVGLVHLWRVANGFTLTLGAAVIPIWASWVAVIVAAFMAYQALAKHRR